MLSYNLSLSKTLYSDCPYNYSLIVTLHPLKFWLVLLLSLSCPLSILLTQECVFPLSNCHVPSSGPALTLMAWHCKCFVTWQYLIPECQNSDHMNFLLDVHIEDSTLLCVNHIINGAHVSEDDLMWVESQSTFCCEIAFYFLNCASLLRTFTSYDNITKVFLPENSCTDR